MTYTEFKAMREANSIEEKRIKNAMRDIEIANGCSEKSLGLTPDYIKAIPAYHDLWVALDRNFQAFRRMNSMYAKQFAKEIRAEIDAKRQGSAVRYRMAS